MREEERPGTGQDPEAGIPDEAHGQADADPAAAFAALCLSVERMEQVVGADTALIRAGVEVVLDRLAALETPIDYGADLGRLVQELGTVSASLEAIERLPVLRQDAQNLAATLERGGADLVAAAAR